MAILKLVSNLMIRRLRRGTVGSSDGTAFQGFFQRLAIYYERIFTMQRAKYYSAPAVYYGRSTL
jgi:hypothetical protein